VHSHPFELGQVESVETRSLCPAVEDPPECLVLLCYYSDFDVLNRFWYLHGRGHTVDVDVSRPWQPEVAFQTLFFGNVVVAFPSLVNGVAMAEGLVAIQTIARQFAKEEMERAGETRRDERKSVFVFAASGDTPGAEVPNRPLVELCKTFEKYLFVREKPLRYLYASSLAPPYYRSSFFHGLTLNRALLAIMSCSP
jgi:hypothetical protein